MGLPPDKKKLLSNLVKKHLKAFAEHDADVGRTELV